MNLVSLRKRKTVNKYIESESETISTVKDTRMRRYFNSEDVECKSF